MDQTQTTPANNQAPSPKQQLGELLRGGRNFIVTTVANPSVDQLAAVLGLTLLLRKTNKNAQGVVFGNLPRATDFLPTYTLVSQPAAQRDFIIKLDTSKTEADKLKYTTEGKQLQVYITPFNGNFTKDDVSFDYGDYHVDGVIALGITDLKKLGELFGKDKALVSKSQVATINNKADGVGGVLSWHEDTSSLSEMIMSMSEALGSGNLDEEIATTLLAGIVDATKQFSAPNTTPKVMTMAAQLMAAGAKQADVMKNLAAAQSRPPQVKQPTKQKQSKPKQAKPAKKTSNDGRVEMKPAQENSLKGFHPSSLGISTEPSNNQLAGPPQAQPPQPTDNQQPPAPESGQNKPSSPTQSAAQPETTGRQPLSPFMAHQLGEGEENSAAQTPPPAANQPASTLSQPQPQTQTASEAKPSVESGQGSANVEEARRAVEQAAQAGNELHSQLQSHYNAPTSPPTPPAGQSPGNQPGVQPQQPQTPQPPQNPSQ